MMALVSGSINHSKNNKIISRNYNCYQPLRKQLEEITKVRFPECLTNIKYIIMLDKEENTRYICQYGTLLKTTDNCICGVELRYNFFYLDTNTNTYFVIGSECSENITKDLNEIKNTRIITQEEEDGIKNWECISKKVDREIKSHRNKNNDCFEDCIRCGLKLVRVYFEPKEGDEYLIPKNYLDYRKFELCKECIELNTINCNICNTEMYIKKRLEKVQRTCDKCIKKKYGKKFNYCINCKGYYISKKSRKSICDKCMNKGEIGCMNSYCNKKIDIEIIYNKPKLFCKDCYFYDNGKEDTKNFWKEYYRS